MHVNHEHFEDVEKTLSLRVFGAFHRAMHAQRQLMTRSFGQAKGRPHPAQMICLKEIAHHEGITQRDLAELMHLSRPTLTVMLQKMEKAGLIERRVDPEDQRYTHIYLRDSGIALHEQAHAKLDEIATEMTAGLSEADQTELIRLLDLLATNISKTQEERAQG